MHTTLLPERPIAPGRVGFRSRSHAAPVTTGPTPGTPRASVLTAPSTDNNPMRA